jgi:hypothetical protein
MKKILLLSIITIAFFSCTTIKKELILQAPLEYSFNSENSTKNDLYVKANEWFVKRYNQTDSQIDFSDKESGKIIGHIMTRYSNAYNSYDIKYTFTIAVLDGTLKLSFDAPLYRVNGTIMGGYTGGYNPIQRDEIKDASNRGLLEIKDNLFSSLSK